MFDFVAVLLDPFIGILGRSGYAGGDLERHRGMRFYFYASFLFGPRHPVSGPMALYYVIQQLEETGADLAPTIAGETYDALDRLHSSRETSFTGSVVLLYVSIYFSCIVPFRLTSKLTCPLLQIWLYKRLGLVEPKLAVVPVPLILPLGEGQAIGTIIPKKIG